MGYTYKGDYYAPIERRKGKNITKATSRTVAKKTAAPKKKAAVVKKAGAKRK